MIKILIKRLSTDVVLPKYETIGSSGMDLAAYIETNINLEPGKSIVISTGLSVAIPQGFEIQKKKSERRRHTNAHGGNGHG